MVTRLVIQTLVWFGSMGLLLFLPAGRWNWPSAWVYLTEMVSLSLVVGLLLAKHDPGVLKERLASPVQKTQPTADKILLLIILVVIFGSMAFMALDAVRFGWSEVPVWVQALGALILLVSVLFNYRTLRTGLPGYQEYTQQVRYRLIPYLW